MAKNPLVEQAKQGNVNAIASLMNRLLKSQGMLANVERDGDRLEILIESDLRSLDDEVRIPKRDILVGMLKKWFITLEIQNVASIRISWQQAGESEPVWTEEIYLVEPVKPSEKLSLPPLPKLSQLSPRDRPEKQPAPIPDLEEMFGSPSVQEQPQPFDLLSAELDADLRSGLDFSNDSEFADISPSQDQDSIYFTDTPSGFDLSRMEEKLPTDEIAVPPDASYAPTDTHSNLLLKTPNFSIQIIQYCIVCAVIILGIRGLHAVLGSSVKASVKAEKTSIIYNF